MTRGGEKSNELSLGDLVLAKVKGFPAWPAKISKPEDWDRAPVPGKYFVLFFGTKEIAFVAPADIRALTSKVKDKLLARDQAKDYNYFAPAVEEICEEFEQLHNRFFDSGDVIHKSDVKYEAPLTPVTAGSDSREAKMKQQLADFHGLLENSLKEKADMRSSMGKRQTDLDLSIFETKSALSSLEKERYNAQKRFADSERATLEKEKIDVDVKRPKLVVLESEVVGLRERVQYVESSLAESVKERDEAVKAWHEADRVHHKVEGALEREITRLKKAHEVEKLRVREEGEQEGMVRFVKQSIDEMNSCYMNGYADALKGSGVPHSDPVWMGLRFPYPNHAPRVTAGWGVSAGTEGPSSVPVAPSQASSP